MYIRSPELSVCRQMFCFIHFLRAQGALLQSHVQEFRPIPAGSDDLSKFWVVALVLRDVTKLCSIAVTLMSCMYKIAKTMEILNTLRLISISTTRPFSAVLDLVSCLLAQMSKKKERMFEQSVNSECKSWRTACGEMGMNQNTSTALKDLS